MSNFITNCDLSLPPSDIFQQFEEHIVDAAKKVAEIEVVARNDWFAENELELLLLIHLRNEA